MRVVYVGVESRRVRVVSTLRGGIKAEPAGVYAVSQRKIVGTRVSTVYITQQRIVRTYVKRIDCRYTRLRQDRDTMRRRV
jgi:hypothetical protein